MVLDSLNFVIISYDVNFWAMGCITTLIKSAIFCKRKIKIFIVQNYKTDNQLELFNDFLSKNKNDFCSFETIIPYGNKFYSGIDNITQEIKKGDKLAEFNINKISRNHKMPKLPGLSRPFLKHSNVLCYVIKYDHDLPDGQYIFIDHDCFVNECFLNKMEEDIISKIKNEVLIIPFHEKKNIGSLTAPMFWLNTNIRHFLKDLPDFAWMTNMSHPMSQAIREKYQKGEYQVYATTEISKKIEKKLNSFPHISPNDTLSCVIRHLFYKQSRIQKYFPEKIIDLVSSNFFGYNEHIWNSGIKYGEDCLDKHQISLFINYFLPTLKKEYFDEDQESIQYKDFVQTLKRSNIYDCFIEKLQENN